MARTIARAHARAQRRLHAMVEAQVYGDPDDRRTRLYVQAERLIDRLKGEPSKFDLDTLVEWRLVAEAGDYSAGIVLPDIPLADRDRWVQP